MDDFWQKPIPALYICLVDKKKDASYIYNFSFRIDTPNLSFAYILGSGALVQP